MSGKSEKDGYLSAPERIKLAKLYRSQEAAYGFIQNLKEQSGSTKKRIKQLSSVETIGYSCKLFS